MKRKYGFDCGPWLHDNSHLPVTLILAVIGIVAGILIALAVL